MARCLRLHLGLLAAVVAVALAEEQAACGNEACAMLDDSSLLQVHGRRAPEADSLSMGVRGTGTGAEAPTHVAVMITGQLVRFVYEDSMPSSFQELLCGSNITDSGKCLLSVDVHVLLADTERNWVPPAPEYPPYSAKENMTETVEAFYRGKGAANVDVQIWSPERTEAEYNRSQARITELAAREEEATRAAWSAAIKTVPDWARQFHQSMHNIMMRDTIFMAVLQAEAQQPWRYDRFLFLRDDNVFHNGSNATAISGKGLLAMHDGANVSVDKWCDFGGVCDKIFLTDRSGAAVLFAPTGEEHVQRMVKWVNRELQTPDPYPWAPERYYNRLLEASNQTVSMVDFRRTEIRYVGGKPCTPSSYIGCTGVHRFPACSLDKSSQKA